MVLHALRLECEKSMELTASSHRFRFVCPIRESWDEPALLESVPSPHWVSDEGIIEGLALFDLTWHIVFATVMWDTFFGRK